MTPTDAERAAIEALIALVAKGTATTLEGSAAGILAAIKGGQVPGVMTAEALAHQSLNVEEYNRAVSLAKEMEADLAKAREELAQARDLLEITVSYVEVPDPCADTQECLRDLYADTADIIDGIRENVAAFLSTPTNPKDQTK